VRRQLSVVDATRHRVLNSITLAGGRAKPVGVVVAPDGRRSYVANGHAKLDLGDRRDTLTRVGDADGSRPGLVFDVENAQVVAA
jgi:DNA-binding beta-propeller fold protein YncE